ncbi:MAG: hypothetical protein K9J30_13545 [Bacteroidales bacterium]|nr:hypothetical protein [Bacteroidales bacterium]
MTKYFLLFGLNRSGTNYLEQLMIKHFDVQFLNSRNRIHPLHKHFRLYDNKSLIGRPNYKNDIQFISFEDFEQKALENKKPEGYVIVSKDPYSWNLSYTKWGVKHNWGESPHPYVLEYNEFYRKWLEFSEETDRIIFVRYMDLLKSQLSVLKDIHKKYELTVKEPFEESDRLKKVPMSRRFSRKKLNYYLKGKYLKKYTREELKELNNHIDHQLLEKLGYKSYF